jgi:hypothetical protein
MAEILLPEKERFQARVRAISTRVDSVSQSNTMAKLLHSNFKNWLQSSAMSPVKLTQELDVDHNGMITGDEFAGLLAKMTGERPPEWVIELVFSFVEADTKSGMPISDWMAFLAAAGLEIPEELYHVPVTTTGSILLDTPSVIEGEPFSVTVSFNQAVDAYEVRVTNTSTGHQESFETSSADMDDPMLDDFVLESDEVGMFTVELLHLGLRLDLAEFEVIPAPPQVEPTTHENEPMDIEDKNPEAGHSSSSTDGTHGLMNLLEALDAATLRSDKQAIIDAAAPQRLRFVILSTQRTLMGNGAYQGGTTLTCESDDGDVFEVMMKSGERMFSNGQSLEVTIVPHSWSLALRHLICREG